jgi:hypothetical protein
MRFIQTIVLFVIAGIFLASGAMAKPKIEMLCDDEHGHHLPSGKLKKIDSAVGCVVVLKGYNKDTSDLSATVWAKWGTKADPKDSEATKPSNGSLTPKGNAFTFDIRRLVLGKDFPACEPFVFYARVDNTEGPVADTKIKIKQDCSKPKPKKITASIQCLYEKEDGTLFRYPGNGTKSKPRLEGKELDCQIKIAKIPDGQEVKGVLVASGKPQEQPSREVPNAGWAVESGFSQENGDFVSCSNFTVKGELFTDGQSVYKGKLDIKQYCPD